MVSRAIRSGISFIRRKPGLVALIYLVNVVTAFVITLPLHSALSEAVDSTGFGFDLAEGLDLVLLADMAESLGPVFGSLMIQLLLILPVIFIAKTAVSVGLINASRDGGIRSFWPGVGQYTGRGLLLGLLFIIAGAILATTSILFVVILVRLFGSAALTFWTFLLILPLLLLGIASWLDLAHDYARIKLVKHESSVPTCFFHGFAWTWRHRSSFLVYYFWFGAALVLVLLPTFLDSGMAATTILGVVALFVCQQLAFILRSACTVGWFASEVAYFENVEWDLAPMIAKTSQTTQVDESVKDPNQLSNPNTDDLEAGLA